MVGEDELKILKSVAKGDTAAFEWLFLRYQPRLIYFLIGLLHDQEVARDMAQDLFLSLWKEREKLLAINSFSAYLFQMAKYSVCNYYDKLIVAEKFKAEYYLSSSSVQSEDEQLFVKELQELIDRTVAAMSDQRRLVYRLSREQGLSNEEIATRLSISKRTVENHLTAVLAILRKVIYLWILMTWKYF